MMSPRTITILGATGSIGTSTLDLVQRNGPQCQVLALTAQSDVTGLAKAARDVNARQAVIGDETLLPELREALAGTSTTSAGGPAAIIEAAASGADYTMCAIVGCAGLRPVMAALAGGKTVALANKEALVSAGDLMIAAARASGATLLPVDSEHNAIFQCLAGNSLDAVSKITLTASGGPFRTLSLVEMAHLTPAQAVKHPNWSMGAKISVDSATMMNKGLELIEADHLFPVGAHKLDILVHPQSIIHSMVEYVDGSVIAQMGAPDMRTPIAHTLAWPQRMESPSPRLDLAKIGRLEFEAPDPARFPALQLARAALEVGGAAPAVLNAANEVAVAAFLAREIGFLDIAARVEAVLARLTPAAPQSLEDVLAVDAEARHSARDMIEKVAA